MINALTKSNYKLQNEYYSRNRTEQNRTEQQMRKKSARNFCSKS